MSKTRQFDLQKLKDLWAGLSSTQRVSLGAVLALSALLLGSVILGVWEPPYRPLYGELAPQTASRIVEELQRQQIPYKLQGDSRVLVPDDRVYEVRLMLAGKNLPSEGGAGFELFDKQDFGVTAFTQQVNYQRALEQELARTISQMEPVRAARVHLVLPKRQLFKEDQKRPSASVILQLSDGKSLNPGQIASVQYLVSAAVEGMSARDIAIVDQRGQVLAKPSDEDGEDGLAATNLQQAQNAELARRMESELTERVQMLLSPLVGADKVRAQVRVELEPVRVVETAEIFDPDKTAVRREQRNEENQANSQQDAAGVVGATATLRGAQGAANQTGAQLSRTSEVIDYEVNKTIRQTQQVSPKIKRVSVAVLIDQSATKNIDAATQASLSSLVGGAVGLDNTRGDALSLVFQPFKPIDAEAEAAAAAASPLKDPIFLSRAIRYGALILIALFVFIFLVRPALKVLKGEKPAEQTQLATVGEKATAAQAGTKLAASEDGAPEIVGRTVAELEQQIGQEQDQALEDLTKKRQRELREQLRLLGQQDPERTAQVLRQWIRMG